MKHTPGPWYAKPTAGNHGQHVVASESTGATVALIYNDNDDAGLIAAMPDMLTGIEQACAALDMCLNSSDTEGALYNADQTLMALRRLLGEVKS